MNVEEVCAFLKQRGVEFDLRDVEHGRQIKAKTTQAESVVVYNTGRVVIGGKKSQLRDELEAWKASGFSPSTVALTKPTGTEGAAPVGLDKRVFIVYGHDTAARDSLELLLRRMGMDPIVLANLPAGGDTIIEKLERYLGGAGNVGFACVLLTPDDEGHRAGELDEKKYRARQNVILELGMVLARLGRSRVAILYKESVERPSDIDGLLYLPFKERVDEVKGLLFRELKEAGHDPDPAAM
ncbi:nucleotide-binding protein [Rothia sp. ARF10]|nr:nucleotide-binding protein [Rothia sp. ARF10]